MKFRVMPPTVLILALLSTPAAAFAAGCPLFLLKDGPGGITLERQAIEPGNVMVFPVSRDSGTITLVLPYAGPGTSGDLVQLSRKQLLITQCVDGELRARVKEAGGSERDLPAVRAADLRRYDIRVSVTAHDGDRGTFSILAGKTIISEDPGPVLDLFAGRLPLGEGDYSVTTEVTLRPGGPRAAGAAPLELHGGYFFVRGRMPGGSEGTFVVDTGGGHSLVAKRFLPDGHPVREGEVVEYSAAGKRSLDYAPGGAGGPVETIVGVTRLEEFRISEIRFDDVPMDVISELPEFGGRRIDGIVGLDLLRRGGVVRFELSAGNPSAPRLVLGGAGPGGDDTVVELPFAVAQSHIFVRGRIAGQAVHFALDTGAPDSFLTRATAARLGVSADPDTTRTARGLDGADLEIESARVDRLELAGLGLDGFPFMLSDLPVLQPIGGGQNAGLIGNSVLSRFTAMEIDFSERVVRLAAKSL
jgi:hypothetical protein